MKKTAAYLLLPVLLLALLFVLPTVAAANNDWAVVQNPNPADRLHLRTQPSEAAASLGKYYNGTLVTILEYTSDIWYKVRIGGERGYLEGYMNRKYLRTGLGNPEDVPSAMPRYFSNSSAWELLDAPSSNASGRTMGYGTKVSLMGFTDQWWHISVGDKALTGFVRASSNALLKPQSAKVNNPKASDRLHLRTQPSITAKSLGKYYNGVSVTVYGYHADNLWAEVQVNGVDGYMLAEYLAVGAAAKNVKSAIPTATIQGKGSVHLRSGASTTSKSLGLFAPGTKVRVLGVGDRFHHVEISGTIGYMVAGYLSPLPK